MSKSNKPRKSKAQRNPIKVAMDLRYSSTETTMRDRRERRPKDKRRSWQNEERIATGD